MPPVLFFNAPRETYRDVIVEKDELYVTREPVGERPRCLQRPPGMYDVAAMIGDFPEPYREPSMVMCQWDCVNVCRPHNLAPLKCPKVLLVGDTHHLGDSLTRAIRLALQEPWDLVVMEFNEHHCRWFVDAGVKNVAYIPCFTINPIDIPPPAKRTRGITCCGSMGEHHVRRRHVVDGLRKRGIEVECFQGTREQCAKVYNESLVSLNISLNGDFNLRNYEIAAAGGCPVTDADLGLLLKRISNIDGEVSLNVGGVQYDMFKMYSTPSERIRLLNLFLNNDIGRNFAKGDGATKNIWERIAMYEQVQELVRQGRWRAQDFRDLPVWNLYE